MSERFIDALGIAAAVACAMGAAACVVTAAATTDDNRALVLKQATTRRWACRVLALLMIITLENIVRHT